MPLSHDTLPVALTPLAGILRLLAHGGEAFFCHTKSLEARTRVDSMATPCGFDVRPS